jgi:hypothetical protein
MYFDEPGQMNTEPALKAAYDRGKTLGLTEAVLASTTGDTAYKALAILTGFHIRVMI